MWFVILVALAIAGYSFYLYRQNRVISMMGSLASVSRSYIYLYLGREYKQRYPDKYKLLAAAVTNMVFGNQPTNAKGSRFVEQHQVLIDSNYRL